MELNLLYPRGLWVENWEGGRLKIHKKIMEVKIFKLILSLSTFLPSSSRCSADAADVFAVKFAKIVGSSEMHVKVGSTISLTCTVNHQVPSIQW